MDYSSWISPGRFSGGFQDVAALSHEMAETFNDPLVGAFSSTGGACGGAGQPISLETPPWWLAGGNSQGRLAGGERIEGPTDGSVQGPINGFISLRLEEWLVLGVA